MQRTRERAELLGNRALASELTADVERLSTLDDLWTLYLADPATQYELQDNLPALESIVGEMERLLTTVSTKSRELRQLVREFPSDLDAELSLLLAEHPRRDRLLELLPEEPFASAIGEACEIVVRQTPSEMVMLAQKLERIASGEFQPGDLSRPFKRALLVVGAGGGLVSVLAGPGALIVLPAAIVAGSGVTGVVATLIAGLAD